MDIDSTTLLRLQTQTAALSLSTSVVSHLAGTLGSDLMRITEDF